MMTTTMMHCERRGDPHFSKNKPLLKHLPLERVNAILRDPDWTRAVFFRDPARRLLSSYLDKFVQHRDYSVTVFGRKKGKRAMTYAEFAEAVANCSGDAECLADPTRPGRTRYTAMGLHSRTNPHWKEQVLVSNVWKFLPAMNFVGSFERLESHARALLERVGIWEAYGARGWGRSGNDSMFATNTVYHRTTASARVKALHSSPRNEETIRRAYWRDYSALKRIGLIRFAAENRDDERSDESKEQRREEGSSDEAASNAKLLHYVRSSKERQRSGGGDPGIKEPPFLFPETELAQEPVVKHGSHWDEELDFFLKELLSEQH